MTIANPDVVAFVLASSDHGPLILSHLDYRPDGNHAGLGAHILRHRQYDMPEVNAIKAILELSLRNRGRGVVMLDCGANVGVMTVDAANWMRGWGSVIAIEPQERLFYALAGNIALQNCWNARAMLAAVDAESGAICVPELDYTLPAQYGGFELPSSQGHREPIGQEYPDPTTVVQAVTIDQLSLARLDLVKMDVEGMELRALAGAIETIKRCRPVFLVEHFKVGASNIEAVFSPLGYECLPMGINILAVPAEAAYVREWRKSLDR